MNYSNKIKFKDIKVKNSKFKLTIVNIMIFILTITAILTASYKDKVKPTTLTFNDVNKLLMDYTVTNPILYEKIKKFMPEEIFYINNINIKNVWASNVIFLEDINNRIYIIGYNQNNRLGMNADDDQFLFLEPLNLQK